MSELPKIKVGKKTHYFDARLKQLRNVDNPHDYEDLTEVEAYQVKQAIDSFGETWRHLITQN